MKKKHKSQCKWRDCIEEVKKQKNARQWERVRDRK